MEEITYLVANFNNGKYIPECMESILEQSSNNWKCIVCDDASTDDSLSIINPYLGPNVKLIKNNENLGYIKTLKRLIDEADTDIVGILDPDDALYPAATEKVLSVYENNNNAGFVYSKYSIYNNEFIEYWGTNGVEIEPGKTSLESGFVSHLKTFRKQVYYKTDGYDERFLYCEDRDIVYKLEEVAEPIFINESIYKYRLMKQSASNDAKNRTKMIYNHYTAFSEALERRNIKGFEYFYYKLILICRTSSNDLRYPRIMRRIFKIISRTFVFIDNKLNIRTGGTLRRT